MNIERLYRLKDLLQTPMPRGKTFNLNHWFSDYTCPLNTGGCGTYCCALGLAALDPVFNEQGLILAEYDHIKGLYYPCFEQHTGYSSARNFFDLTYCQAFYIFSPLHYESAYDRNEVVEHIQDILDGYEPVDETE